MEAKERLKNESVIDGEDTKENEIATNAKTNDEISASGPGHVFKSSETDSEKSEHDISHVTEDVGPAVLQSSGPTQHATEISIKSDHHTDVGTLANEASTSIPVRIVPSKDNSTICAINQTEIPVSTTISASLSRNIPVSSSTITNLPLPVPLTSTATSMSALPSLQQVANQADQTLEDMVTSSSNPPICSKVIAAEVVNASGHDKYLGLEQHLEHQGKEQLMI